MTCCRGTGILSYKIIPAKEVRNTPLQGLTKMEQNRQGNTGNEKTGKAEPADRSRQIHHRLIMAF